MGRVRVWTIGHGARTIDAFLAILTEAQVATLVDVRRFPGSRRHPQFGRDELASAVRGAGVEYTWAGEVLGGRRSARPGSRHTALRNAAFVGYADHMDTAAFRTAIDELLRAPGRPAVMCAETLWWHCHRMLIADALVLRGGTVSHLLGPGQQQPHRLTSGVRPDADGRPVYDATEQPALPGL
ncbi:hypothetical protein GCM10017581_053020 [Dactylosporangium matsuzakiense]|uniref:DUF488 domain-containing protein n=1 Tax=Dactylosporangium matsuzakiense TaxID=53360 RepID=A0A9W6KK64_9ACTN|nr:hypothetical protein GCM10017581_053020 [Dactylosporangium matsuzakiense]